MQLACVTVRVWNLRFTRARQSTPWCASSLHPACNIYCGASRMPHRLCLFSGGGVSFPVGPTDCGLFANNSTPRVLAIYSSTIILTLVHTAGESIGTAHRLVAMGIGALVSSMQMLAAGLTVSHGLIISSYQPRGPRAGGWAFGYRKYW
jgi:hypothetical protein